MRRQIEDISPEDAQAEEERLSSTKHFAPAVKPTLKKYDRVADLWREFYEWRKLDASKCLQQNEAAPSNGRLKQFMEWIFNTTVGNLTDKITLRSLKNTWYSFRAMYERKTYTPIPKDTGQDVLSYIKTELREKGLALVRRQREIADQLDVALMLNYLWCYDKHDFRHPRRRLDYSLILLFLIYTGARPGSIIESSAYRGSNEAMCYKDIELIGLPEPDGTMELVLKVRFRYEKRRRAPNGIEDDGIPYKWVTFREDRSCRGRCPVTHFLGLAFADDAFADLRKPEDLHYLRVPGRKHSMSLKFKDSHLNMPLFRHCERDGRISDHRAMTYNELARDLVLLGIRVGFLGTLRPYNLRRGTANSVDGNVEVSANQYAQLLGHAVKTMGASYISDISAIDVQGIVNEEQARKDHIAQLRRMTLHLDIRAPSSLPTLENLKVLSDPEFVEALSIEDGLYKRMQSAAPGDEYTELAHEYQSAHFKRRRCYTRLHDQALLRFRKEYFSTTNSEEIREMIKRGEQGLPPKDGGSSTLEELKFVSHEHFPDRHYIATSFWTSCKAEKAGPDPVLVEQLRHLGNPGPYALYYPGEYPIDGYCPVCRQSLDTRPLGDRPSHIHSCFKAKYVAHNKIKFENECPVRCKWGACKSNFMAKETYLPRDCGMHIQDLKERQRYRAAESRRLNKRRRKSKDVCNTAGTTHQSRKAIAAHFRKHLKPQQTQCLWDRCRIPCSSEVELRRHLNKEHYINVRQAPFEPQFCLQHPSEGWFHCEFEWEDHCRLHVEEPSASFGLYHIFHVFLAGLQCPICLGDEGLINSKRFTQFTDRGSFNIHMDRHKERSPERPLSCPIRSCKKLEFAAYSDLELHFLDCHDLKPKGFAQNLPVERWGRSRGDSHDDSDNETLCGAAEQWDSRTLVDEDGDEDDWEDASGEDGWDDMSDADDRVPGLLVRMTQYTRAPPNPTTTLQSEVGENCGLSRPSIESCAPQKDTPQAMLTLKRKQQGGSSAAKRPQKVMQLRPAFTTIA